MKRRLTPFLLSAILVLPALPTMAAGEGDAAVDRDAVELLEMQLADARNENTRLKANLAEQESALKDLQEQKRDTTKQEALLKAQEENALLQAELTKLDRDLQEIGKSRDALSRKLDATQDELKVAKSANKGRTDDTKALEELTARCRNLEDENSILKQEIDDEKQRTATAEAARKEAKADFDRLFAKDESDQTKHKDLAKEASQLKQKLEAAEAECTRAKAMLAEVKGKSIDEQQAKALAAELEEARAIEAQRKEALDGLFKQLASVKAELKTRDVTIEELEADISAGQQALRAAQAEKRSGTDRLKTLQASLNDLETQSLELTSQLKDAEATILRKENEVRDEVAARQATEARLDRIKLTDDQRKKTMDDVLTRLATAEKQAADRADRITVLEGELEKTTATSASTVSGLERRATTLQDEVTRLEGELKLAIESKAAVTAKVAEHEAAAQRDAARLVELEASLARVNATDTQRKKAMDKLLLELAALEDGQGTLRADLASSQREVARLKAESKTRSADVTPDVKGELAALEEENAKLRRQVSALEARQPETVTALPSTQSSGDSEKLFELERAEFKKAKADLEDEISILQKSSADQAAMLSRLKADLAEAERSKNELSSKVKELEGRKVDVRNSDLFKEMEKVNVTLREKLVQVESERQRLSKAAKKLEKRDDGYDDEIGHEKELRRKAETELVDARAREVEYQELIEKLTTQVPQLEQRVADLESTEMKLEQELTDRQEDLQALKVELEKREHRLIKAERVAEVLESAREDVLHASDKEKLDMHYNMAAVYARENKFEEAEQEYLHALRLDPLDADVHYNLGILYDDELKSPAKAAVHYRRYLKLNPHGTDADQVRDWLMKLEMKMKR